jgi:hypothetical protein
LQHFARQPKVGRVMLLWALRGVYELHGEVDALGKAAGRAGVMMCFSRRIGAVPSIERRVREPWLVTTQSPIMMRSSGLSLIFSATFYHSRD